MKAKLAITNQGEGEFNISKTEMSLIGKFFNFFIPDFAKDGIGIVNDNIKFIRWKNMVEITKQADELSKKNHLPPFQLSLKFQKNFIDAASVEEDPSLQKMWANLLTNTYSGMVVNDSTFTNILKEISPVSAQILDEFYKSYKIGHIFLLKSNVLNLYKNNQHDGEFIIDNLIRLRLINYEDPSMAHLPMGLNMGYSYHSVIPDDRNDKIIRYLKDLKNHDDQKRNKLQLTSLGRALMVSCNEPI